MKGNEIRIIPIGGLGEVGRNMMLYEYQDSMLIVDCGLMFPNNDQLGIDYIIPDYSYILKNRQKVKGVIFTHGHEDHIGSIHYLMNEIQIPIYATPLTMGLVKAKLDRKSVRKKLAFNIINAGKEVRIGKFNVTTFHVCHSIPDSIGLAVETPAGLIIQSGDFKFDHTPVDNWPTDYAKLAELSKRGVMALIADSTNATHAGWTPSERVINGALQQVFLNAKGRIIVASFASLISRMQQVANTADVHKRKIAFVGKSMLENVSIARKLGYLNIADDLIVSIEDALKIPDEKIVIMCTGSQGEPTSILGRLSRGTQRQFDVKQGDTIVLSSKTIPGNEEAVFSTINDLFRRGANVIYEEIAPVHVSGHGSQEDIKLLIHLTKPKYFIPAYGELRHLKQSAILAMQTGIPEDHIAVVEDGQIISFKNGKMRLAEKIAAPYVFVDGVSVGEISHEELRDRATLSKDGIVSVHVNLDRKTGQLRGKPAIASRGFASSQESQEILQQAIKPLVEAIKRSNGNLGNNITKSLGAILYRETHRRPTILVTVSRI